MGSGMLELVCCVSERTSDSVAEPWGGAPRRHMPLQHSLCNYAQVNVKATRIKSTIYFKIDSSYPCSQDVGSTSRCHMSTDDPVPK